MWIVTATLVPALLMGVWAFGPRAVLLSPFSKPTRLDTYRGIVLPLGEAVRERALALIAANLPAAEPSC